jgi:hypothetical protein
MHQRPCCRRLQELIMCLDNDFSRVINMAINEMQIKQFAVQHSKWINTWSYNSMGLLNNEYDI